MSLKEDLDAAISNPLEVNRLLAQASDANNARDDTDDTATASNTTHRTSDGTDHANVVTNDTHVAGNGADHANVATNTTGVATNVTNIALVNKLNKTKLAQLVFDFAVDGGTASAISMLDSDGVVFSLPDNSIITKAYYEVITTFASPTGPDDATISIGHADDAAGIVAAAAINVGTAFDQAIPKDCIQDGAMANAALKSTAARPILLTIGVEDITAGKLHLFLEFVTTE